MSSNYPPGTWEGDPRAPWNDPDPYDMYGEEEITVKARELCLNDGQIWLNLSDAARQKYIDDAIEEFDMDWVDEQEARAEAKYGL
jgi:hypothetical protein